MLIDWCLVQSPLERLPLEANGNMCRGPQPYVLRSESLNWRSLSNLLPQNSENSMKKGTERVKDNTRRTKSSES